MIHPLLNAPTDKICHDMNKYYLGLLQSSSLYYLAKKSARNSWMKGDKTGMENAKIKFSYYLYQLDYELHHFLHGPLMSMSGLHQ